MSSTASISRNVPPAVPFAAREKDGPDSAGGQDGAASDRPAYPICTTTDGLVTVTVEPVVTIGTADLEPVTPHNPFNFDNILHSAGRTGSASRTLGRRHGHKYKHSSVSHQAVLDVEQPASMSPLQMATSVPVPTVAEFISGVRPGQKRRLACPVVHLAVVVWLKWLTSALDHSDSRSDGSAVSAAVAALAQTAVFDLVGSTIAVSVTVAANFEAWDRRSVSMPFGLRRLELVASLVSAVTLVFLGFDLMSHSVVHVLVGHPGDTHAEDNHHPLPIGQVWMSPPAAAIAAIGALLLSSAALSIHSRLGRALRTGGGEVRSALPSGMANPVWVQTVGCAVVVVVLSVLPLSKSQTKAAAFVFCLAVAGWMMVVGVRLCISLGQMLLMTMPVLSCPPSSALSPSSPAALISPFFPLPSSSLPSAAHTDNAIASLVSAIKSDPAVESVDDARFWQAHFDLAIATIRVSTPTFRASDTGQIRDRISTLVRNRLSGGYGDTAVGFGPGFRWEVSVEVRLVG